MPLRTLCTVVTTAAFLSGASAAGAAPSVPRCGWLLNPTPANWILVDREGEWLLGMQGGHQAPGLDTLPDVSARDWVVTNGSSYGYGCACMTIEAGGLDRVVERISDFRQLPIATCRRDKRLSRPG